MPDGPWAKEYIALQIQEFDLDEWRQMDWEDGIDVEATRELDAGKEFQLRSILQDAERDAKVEKWLVERVRSLDTDIGRQFESRKSVSDRTELFRTLVEDEGFYIDVELIMLEWEERKLGFSDELIANIAEDFRDMYETSAVYWSLGSKAGTVHSLEIDICRLLMETVAGEHPRSIITDGNCEIEKAIEIAQENLAANGGQFARTEDDFRHWIEFADSVESGEHDADRGEYVNPNPDDDEDDNYDG